MRKKRNLATLCALVAVLSITGCGSTNNTNKINQMQIQVDNGTPANEYKIEVSEGTVAAYPGSNKFATIKMGVYEKNKQTELCNVKLAYDYFMSSTGMNNTGKNTQMDDTAGRLVEDIVKNNKLNKSDVYPATINISSAGLNENNLTFTIMKHKDLNIKGVKEMYSEGKDIEKDGLKGYLRYSKDNSSAVLVVELDKNWTLGIQNSGKNIAEMSDENLAKALIELVSVSK